VALDFVILAYFLLLSFFLCFASLDQLPLQNHIEAEQIVIIELLATGTLEVVFQNFPTAGRVPAQLAQ
jgi:hypothetical protein